MADSTSNATDSVPRRAHATATRWCHFIRRCRIRCTKPDQQDRKKPEPHAFQANTKNWYDMCKRLRNRSYPADRWLFFQPRNPGFGPHEQGLSMHCTSRCRATPGVLAAALLLTAVTGLLSYHDPSPNRRGVRPGRSPQPRGYPLEKRRLPLGLVQPGPDAHRQQGHQLRPATGRRCLSGI